MALAVCLVLIGPVMYVFSRVHALDLAMARIHPGETMTDVTAALGRPQQERPLRAPASAELEYRYTVWPMPAVWVISFKGGRVVATSRE